MLQLSAYLGFDGTCAEALKSDAKVLAGKIVSILTNAEARPPLSGDPSNTDRVMHGAFVIDGQIPGQPYAGKASTVSSAPRRSNRQSTSLRVLPTADASSCRRSSPSLPSSSAYWSTSSARLGASSLPRAVEIHCRRAPQSTQQ